jgi:hypothetical protein
MVIKCPNCPHPVRGTHHYKTGKCKLCRCEGPNGTVKGGYASSLAREESRRSVPERHRSRIAKQDAVMPKPMIDVLTSDFGAALSRDFNRLTKGKKR